MRIVSLAPSNTEILFSLGLKEEIVAVTRLCDFPEEAKLKPKVGGWIDPDIEKIVSLNPDVVFTSTFLQEKIAQNLRQRGMNIVHLDMRTLGQLFESITKIGETVSKQVEAKKLTMEMENEIEKVRQKAKNFPKKRVYAEEWHDPPFACGNWIPELIEIANGVSFLRPGEISRQVHYDEIEEFDPEYIVLTWCGFKERSQIGWVKKREGWDKIRAVKNDKVFAFHDSFLNRPGPRIVDGLKMLSETIHHENKEIKRLFI